MSLPKVVSRDEWLVARKGLLAEEKAMTRARDALSTKRRELPMVLLEKEYVFDGPQGKTSLRDLFDGRRQLIVQHFMFDPTRDEGCPSCSAASDELSDGLLNHLHARDTTLVVVSRAPLDRIDRYKRSKGWTFPWYSSFASDFNYDFHVTIDSSVARSCGTIGLSRSLKSTAWAGSVKGRRNNPATACSCSTEMRSITPIPCMPAAPRDWEAPTTSST